MFKKNLGPKKFQVPKNWVQKKCWVQKILGTTILGKLIKKKIKYKIFLEPT